MPPLPLPQMMQGAGAPPIPPTMGAAPQMGGTGPAVTPSPMAGAGAKSMMLVKTAVAQLQDSLSGLPMGSDVHNAVLKAIGDISKHLGKGPDDASQIVQQLAQLARSQQQNPQQQQAIQRLFPQQSPGPGASPPAAPPPAAEAA